MMSLKKTTNSFTHVKVFYTAVEISALIVVVDILTIRRERKE